jgi:ketosteroid isomerase-like protein
MTWTRLTLTAKSRCSLRIAMQNAAHKLSPEESLRAANTNFYAAFESLDLVQMEGVWAHDDDVSCVHAGSELLLGWEEVRERWARIFANAKKVRVALSCVWLRVEGNAGWVVCTERVTTAFTEGFDDARVQATNIFVRTDDGWLLVARHASPLPSAARTPVQ